jgi:ribosomal protein L33
VRKHVIYKEGKIKYKIRPDLSSCWRDPCLHHGGIALFPAGTGHFYTRTGRENQRRPRRRAALHSGQMRTVLGGKLGERFEFKKYDPVVDGVRKHVIYNTEGKIKYPAYRWIARHRYRLFGRRSQCLLPDPIYAGRFLD